MTMYENGIDVVYEVSLTVAGPRWWSEHRKVTLPGWCAGDPHMALALYLFGHRDHEIDVRVVDWQPHVDTIADSAREFECPDGCEDRAHLHELDRLTETAKRMGLA